MVEKQEATLARAITSQTTTEESKNESSSNSTDGGFVDLMLAHNYNPDKHDPTGWLMSEKLDGVRCYWNGKNMYTRTGKPFYAPADFKAKLPPIAIDGELFTKRDDFQKIVSIVRKKDVNN